jgi:hypothetical protein
VKPSFERPKYELLGGEVDIGEGRPPRLIDSLEAQRTREGGSITLKCRFAGSPKLTAMWFVCAKCTVLQSLLY